MTDETGYNGWKNYETWCVALWIDNDEGSYDHSRKLAREAMDDDERGARGTLADSLREWLDADRPDLGATVWADLLNAGISEVDWYEVADQYLSEVESAEA